MNDWLPVIGVFVSIALQDSVQTAEMAFVAHERWGLAGRMNGLTMAMAYFSVGFTAYLAVDARMGPAFFAGGLAAYMAGETGTNLGRRLRDDLEQRFGKPIPKHKRTLLEVLTGRGKSYG